MPTKTYTGAEVRAMLVAGAVPDVPAEVTGIIEKSITRAKARGTHLPGVMNKGEARFAAHLEEEKDASFIEDWKFEPITFKLGPDLRYTPDFFVVLIGGFITFYEVKAEARMDPAKPNVKSMYRAEEDAMVKIRAAVQQNPWFRFRIVWWSKKTARWAFRTIGETVENDVDVKWI